MFDDYDTQAQCEEFYVTPECETVRAVAIPAERTDLEKLYGQLTATLETHGQTVPENVKAKLAVAKVYLGDYLDQKFPIMRRSLLLGMVTKKN